MYKVGYTKYDSNKMTIFQMKSEDEINSLIKEANFIITHGGVGSIMTSIKHGKKVIAVPRKSEYKEHVNNHQIQIIEEFNDNGSIIGINSVEDLEEAIKRIDNFIPQKYISKDKNIINIIQNYIENN